MQNKRGPLAAAAIASFIWIVLDSSIFLRIYVPVLKVVNPILFAIIEDVRIPDPVLDMFLRSGMRLGLPALVFEFDHVSQKDVNHMINYARKLKEMPIALFTDDANEQHYQVETRFFNVALGKRKKYSSGYWEDAANSTEEPLDAAEDRMLSLYIERAQIVDGMHILDLGCGWGSLTLFLAERFPNARITGVSNSRTQREHILSEVKNRGFGSRVDVHTLNVATEKFQDKLMEVGPFDRILSIEMFEHMKNYKNLLRTLSNVLKPDTGKLFLHIFCHKYFSFDFDEENPHWEWMTRHFFRGGTMPSQFLLQEFQDDLKLENKWNVNGMHYAKTLEAWLQKMDKKKDELLRAFGGNELQIRRWRIFMIACAEFFAFRGGGEFFVTHLLFSAPGDSGVGNGERSA